MYTLVCGSCAVAAATVLTGCRRVFRIDRPGLCRTVPWAPERPLSAPSLAHRSSMVALRTPRTAAGERAGASGRQQQQQRAARRSIACAPAIGSSRGQPRCCCRRAEQRRGGGACAARTPQGAVGAAGPPPVRLGVVRHRLWRLVPCCVVACQKSVPRIRGGCMASCARLLVCPVLFYTLLNRTKQVPGLGGFGSAVRAQKLPKRAKSQPRRLRNIVNCALRDDVFRPLTRAAARLCQRREGRLARGSRPTRRLFPTTAAFAPPRR